MQFRGQGPATIGIVFDSDMGESIDSALALALLYGLQSKNEARVIALSVSKPCLKAAACCEAIARFYGGEPSPFVPPLSIGMAEAGPAPAETPIISAVTAKFPGTIKKLNDTADPAALIRNALTAQTDHNAAVVLAGPATNLARLLDLPGAKEVIAQKVKLLAIAEPRLERDPAAAKRVLANWPTPIVTAGADIGDAVPFPGASIEKDFAWSPAHPVVEAYRAFRTMPYDAPSTAMAAALHVGRPKETYFTTEKGRLGLDPAQKDKIVQAYTDLASAKPAPRRRFGRG